MASFGLSELVSHPEVANSLIADMPRLTPLWPHFLTSTGSRHRGQCYCKMVSPRRCSVSNSRCLYTWRSGNFNPSVPKLTFFPFFLLTFGDAPPEDDTATKIVFRGCRLIPTDWLHVLQCNLRRPKVPMSILVNVGSPTWFKDITSIQAALQAAFLVKDRILPFITDV